MISQVLLTSEQPKKNKMASVGILSHIKLLWAASYSACVVYNKTIIHLSVGESGGYLFCPYYVSENRSTLSLFRICLGLGPVMNRCYSLSEEMF